MLDESLTFKYSHSQATRFSLRIHINTRLFLLHGWSTLAGMPHFVGYELEEFLDLLHGSHLLPILFVKNEKVAKMVISRSLSFSSYNHTFMAKLSKPRPKKNAHAHGKLWRNMKGRKLTHNCEYNMRT